VALQTLVELPHISTTLRPRLSIVIPTRNRRATLAETLAALDAQAVDANAVEMIVVDNGSQDGTADWIRARSGRLACRLLIEPRRGPAAARNRGIAASQGEVVLLLGDDMRAAGSELLEHHVRLHDADRRPAYAVLGRVRWRQDRPATSFMRWLEHGPQFAFHALEPGAVPAGPYFYTSHLSVKKTALEQVGGFDERFPFAAVEDVEIGVRLERAGLELDYHPELLVEHDHWYTPAAFSARQERVGAAAHLMRDLLGDQRPLPGPSWSWPLLRTAAPTLLRFAGWPCVPKSVWKALSLAGYARGWANAPEVLRRGGHKR